LTTTTSTYYWYAMSASMMSASDDDDNDEDEDVGDDEDGGDDDDGDGDDDGDEEETSPPHFCDTLVSLPRPLPEAGGLSDDTPPSETDPRLRPEQTPCPQKTSLRSFQSLPRDGYQSET
jgi:hypothetical protein